MTRDGDRLPGRTSRSRGPGAPGGAARTATSQPQLVRDLLATYLDRSGLREGVEAASVVDEWPECVGPGIAAVTRVRKVSDGVLVVAVATSAWLMELNLMKRDLLRRLNAGKKAGKIRQIVFVMDG